MAVHLPVKGEGHNHRRVVRERKIAEDKRRGQVTSRHKTNYMCQHCNVYLCIGPPGESWFVDIITHGLFTGSEMQPYYEMPYHSKMVQVHYWLSRKRSLRLRLSIGD